MKLRVLIVDDEPLARERLRQLLESEADVEVVGEATNGVDAIEAAEAQNPDLMLLDIHMPELDGFGVLEALRGEKMPLIIFVTAYDQFALKAFEVHAVDYLLKPIERERFQLALQRAWDRYRQRKPAEENQRMEALLQEVKPSLPRSDRLVIKSDGRVLFLRLVDIDWVEAADNYIRVHAGNEGYLARETMTSIENRLPSEKFMRISRSALVNLERIKELQPMFHGDYVVILRNGTKLTLSRNYRDKLQALLGH